MNPPIGPGRLVLVVGPSGAGKDTLLALARAECRGNERIVFPRRVITRPSDGSEDHDVMSEAAFDRAVMEGTFAMWWGAHGNKYGIPVAVNGAIEAGATVVCNVSRAVIDLVRMGYASVTVVLVTAPPDILAQRLAGRGRASDGDLAKRIARSAELEDEFHPDVVIMNVGEPVVAAASLVNAIRGRRRRFLFWR